MADQILRMLRAAARISSGHDTYCSFCANTEDRGHASDCKLAEAIKLREEELACGEIKTDAVEDEHEVPDCGRKLTDLQSLCRDVSSTLAGVRAACAVVGAELKQLNIELLRESTDRR